MSVRLFIGNLPYSATEADLRALFSEVAEPSQVVLPTDRETGRPRGFAFVDFAERDHAEQVINRYNGQPFSGRPLAVSEARAREDRPAGPRPGGYGGGGGFGGGAPRPGGFGGPPSGGGFGGPRPGGPPRPGGFAPRDGGGMPPTGPEVSRRARGPVKGPIRKQTYDKPRGPIKQRPVSRLYDDEEDLVETTTVEFDDVSKAADDAPDADGPDVDVRDDHADDDE